MLAVINKIDVESTFNARSPKPFIDRIQVTENIDETNPSTNSSISIAIDSHVNDISLGDDELAILDNPYLLESLYVHFLLVKSSHYEDLNTDNFYKLSSAWQIENLKTENYSKSTFKLSELFNFDVAEDRKELSKSLRFEDSDADIYVLPFQTIQLDIPMRYSAEGVLFDENVYLIAYVSPDEDELKEYDSLSLKQKNYLNSFFSGVNHVDLVIDQDINDQKLAFFDPAASSYWQTEVIKDSNGRFFGAQTFSAREVLTKYYEFVLNKERETAPSERVRMRDFFINLKTPFFSTKPDMDCVFNLKDKVDSLVEDYAGQFEELAIINSAIKFINGIDQQLSRLPLLESRLIGDIRIQRSTLNFLEGIQVGLTDTEVAQKQADIAQQNIFSDFSFTSDDDGSVELYLMLNKTNLMKKNSNLLLRFPNLRTYVPEIDSFFSVSRAQVFRKHEEVEPGNASQGFASVEIGTEIGDFRFEVDDAETKNKNTEFRGKFVGQREILEIQQQDVTTTEGTVVVTEGVEDAETAITESDSTATTTTRTISEAVVSTIDVSTNGFATALAHFDSSGDEVVVFCVNDQSVNAASGEPVESIVKVRSASSLSFEKENRRRDSESDQERTEEIYDEFSDVDGDTELHLAYKLTYSMSDFISMPVLSLFQELERVVESLQEYELEASERCSFNDIAFKFNDFFIDQQYRKYAILSEAPWNKLSSALALHATLFNRFPVLQNQILYNAKQIKRKLDPKSASLYTIRLVLQAALNMKEAIKEKLISLGAIRFNSGLGRYIDSPSFSRKDYPEVSTTPDKMYVAKLSQYDGITQLDPTSENNVETVFSPPNLDTLLGQFVMKLKAPINKLYRDSYTGDRNFDYHPDLALRRLAGWVIRNRRSLKNKLPDAQKDNFNTVARMKLNLITPYRNTTVISDEFGWRNNSIKVKGRFEALESGISLEDPSFQNEYTVDFSDFNRQILNFEKSSEVRRSLQRLTYLRLTYENIFGNVYLPTGKIDVTIHGGKATGNSVSRDEEPEYKTYYMPQFAPHRHYDSRIQSGIGGQALARFFRDAGFGENKHHIVFYSSNNTIANKSSHNDYNGSNLKTFLNNNVFRTVNRGGSGVNDRSTLKINNSSQASRWLSNFSFLREFNEAYLVAFAEVFSHVDFGDGFVPTTDLLINGNIDDHLFVRLYESGFYPWPGFPELPDSIDLSLDEFIGN